jgi:hypothetical protein
MPKPPTLRTFWRDCVLIVTVLEVIRLVFSADAEGNHKLKLNLWFSHSDSCI